MTKIGTRAGLLSVKIMLLSGKSVHDAGGLLVSWWNSTTKSSGQFTVTSQHLTSYDLRCCCQDVKSKEAKTNYICGGNLLQDLFPQSMQTGYQEMAEIL